MEKRPAQDLPPTAPDDGISGEEPREQAEPRTTFSDSARAESVEKPEPAKALEPERTAHRTDVRRLVMGPRARIISLIFLAGALVVLIGAALLRWDLYSRPVGIRSGAATADVFVEEGDSAARIMARMMDAGLDVTPLELRLASRLHERGMSRVHAGLYRFEAGGSVSALLDRLAMGPLIDQQVRIPDGAPIWTVRALLAGAVNLKPESAGMSDEAVREALGLSAYPSIEGFIAPDTYRYGSGTSDIAVMRRAVDRQRKLLEEAWNTRSPNVRAKSPYELLILASIIERESGIRSDRHLVSSVFNNRLAVGMPLQTDPTVIYGLGENWNGNLTKKDLQTSTPYNTYRMTGLPPTPIGMPTPASIEAAAHPADTRYLYFVARGDGTSEFTTNLNDHNRAVRHYILEKRTAPFKPSADAERGPLRPR